MKNFIFALLAALSSFSVSAQMPIPYFQDFENGLNGTFPNEYDNIDNDNCYLTGTLDVWKIGLASSSTVGDSAASVSSMHTDTNCVADDWLIFGPFTGITPLTKWKWDSRADYANESFIVYACPNNTPADCLQQGAIDSFLVIENFRFWYNDSVSLAAFDGQTIYLAYRYVSRNKGFLAVNNIHVFNDTTTAVNQAISNKDILIYPNPNNGAFSVKTTEVVEYIQVVDVLGKVIAQKMPQSNNENIDLSAYPSGVYFVQLRDKNTIKTIQIQKQ